MFFECLARAECLACIAAPQPTPRPYRVGDTITRILQTEALRGPAQDHTTGEWKTSDLY